MRWNGNYEFGLSFFSSELREQISERAGNFNCSFHEEAGRSSEALRQEHLAEGLRLQGVRQKAVGAFYRVELNDLGSGGVQI